MIYLITNNKSVNRGSPKYDVISYEQALKELQELPEFYLDTETQGFDCHTVDMILLQLGDQYDQYLFDTLTVDIRSLKEEIEKRKIIGQNLKFDLKFLYKKGIYPTDIYDTFVAEKVITCGHKLAFAGLDFLVKKYVDPTIILDKSIRADIHKQGLSEEVISYSANDIKHLPEIRRKQTEIMRAENIDKACALEFKFTPALAYIEYCGFKLDESKWQAKMKTDYEKFIAARDVLDDWVMSNGLSKYIDTQLDMFAPLSCSINWASSHQVLPLFEDLGINCTFTKKGVTKKSVEAKVIGGQEKSFPIISLYLEYKGLEKVISTYGESFIRQINPATGRLHTNFKQIMDTGRISSGGKDRITGEEYINFQNIPANDETRECFVAEPGNTLIVADYSGQEQIMLANKSMDKNLLDFYDRGLGDMHSFVASKMYPELEGLPLEEVKANHGDKRNNAKGAGFAINYGGNGNTIADNLGLTVEEGAHIFDSYFEAFPGLSVYFKEVQKQGLRDGYVLISSLTGRKSYIPFFDEFKSLEEEMDSKFWNNYRAAKTVNSANFPILKQKVSDYFKHKGDIERKTLNYPIQGSSAEVTKISCYMIYHWILQNNLFGIVKFVNTVHDENVLECPLEMADLVVNKVREFMELAGTYFCTRVLLKAEPKATPVWKK